MNFLPNVLCMNDSVFLGPYNDVCTVSAAGHDANGSPNEENLERYVFMVCYFNSVFFGLSNLSLSTNYPLFCF